MKNQKIPSDTSNTTAVGTTIAGIRVDRFEVDCLAAALLVAAADVVEEVVVRTVEDDEAAAAADVREAYSAESVIVLITSPVNVDPLFSRV